MSVRAAQIAVLVLLLTGFPAQLFAEQAQMSADNLEGSGEFFRLEGNVRIHRGDVGIEAGRAHYDRSTGDISASDGFTYDSPLVHITARSAELNLESGQGTLYGAEAVFKDGGFRISGEEIRRVGPDRFLIRRGSATTCEGIPPAWCFRGRDFDVEVGERLVARGVTFRIRDVPVMYVPYAWVPVVTERRTGLLPPTLGYRDSTGAFFRQPFYWAPTGNRDATLYLDFHSKEAFGQGIEYRYVEGPDNRGQWYVYHLRDSERNVDFYEGTALHRTEGERIEGFLDSHLVNRRDYFRIYEPYLEESTKRYLYSRAEAWANLPGNSRLYVRSKYYQDMDETVANREVLQELPGAGLHIAPAGFGPLTLGGEARTFKFRRHTGYDGERTDGALNTTLRFGRSHMLVQSGNARRVFYRIEDNGAEAELYNTLLEYRAEARTTMARRYEQLTHAIKPAIYYERRWRDGEPPPLFDETELFEETELAGFELVNLLAGFGRHPLKVRIVQEYDLDDDAEKEPWLPLLFDLAVQGRLELGASLAYDHYDERPSRSETRLALKFGRTRLKASQSFVREHEIEFYTASIRQELNDVWAVEAGMRYDEGNKNGEDELEEVSAAIAYTAQCWSVAIEGIRRPDDYSVFLTIGLAGLGEAGTR